MKPDDIDFDDLDQIDTKFGVGNGSPAERRRADAAVMLIADRKRMDRGDRSIQTNLKFTAPRKKAMLADAGVLRTNLTVLMEVGHDLLREALQAPGGHDKLRTMIETKGAVK